MTEDRPIHQLYARLVAARLEAIEKAAARGNEPLETLFEDLRAIACLQGAATAVKEAIDAHAVKEGWGGEQPLK